MSTSFHASQREFLKRLVAYTVKVEPSTQDGCGAGFVISLDGYILTAKHVMGDAKSAVIRFLRLNTGDWTIETGGPKTATLVAADSELDIALLRLDRIPPRLTAVALGTSSEVRPGTPLWRVGIDDIPLSNGYCFHIQRKIFDRDDVLIGMEAGPGSSGGPIFNETGHVVGVALMYQPDEKRPPYSVALPIDKVIKRFLEKYALQEQLTTGKTINLFSSS